MPKIVWYKSKDKSKYDPQVREALMDHAYLEKGGKNIFIPTDDPLFEPHVALSHEIAHLRLGHGDYHSGSEIGDEYQAVEQTIRQLKSVGEWTKSARESTVIGFASYVGLKDAEKIISSMEKRVDRELKNL